MNLRLGLPPSPFRRLEMLISPSPSRRRDGIRRGKEEVWVHMPMGISRLSIALSTPSPYPEHPFPT
jgi:hypothetical protein